MRANRSKNTGPELALRRVLHARGLRYRVNTRPEPRIACRADIVFRKRMVAVFVDGCFWHRCPLHATDPKRNAAYWQAKFKRVTERDRRNDLALAAAGWTVLRVWEHEDPAHAADRIEGSLRGSSVEARPVVRRLGRAPA
jgi:DNA mismatch endonuclease (patch repair protein)